MPSHHYLIAGLIIAAVTSATAVAAPPGGSDRDLSALLKRQTQAFSEAGQAGDTATLGKFLDPDVVFMNETGEIVTKADMTKSDGAAPRKPTDRSIEVTDWVLRRQGGGQTATATFVDVLTQHFHGQTLVYRFRSTETWAKRADGWKMIASQTMNVQQEPPAVRLSAEDLDTYVGVYQADQDFKVIIARSAEGLTTSTSGGPPVAIKAELRDVFFLPGIPNMRRIFKRDAKGQVTGYVSRRDGVDIVLSKVS
jgi:ketosteroid isomerase-like protein